MEDPGLFRRIIHPDDREQYIAHRQRHLTEHVPGEVSFRIVRAGGEVRFIEHICQPVFDANGGFIGTRGSNRDVTVRKTIQEALKVSMQRFRDLVNLLPVHVFETDITGRVTFINKNVTDTVGVTQEDLEHGFALLDSIIPEDRERARQNTIRRYGGEKIDGAEYTVIRKDGTTFPVITYADPIVRDGKPVGLRGVSLDITERKKVENELAHHKEHLEELVLERTHELELLIGELKSAMASVKTLRGFIPICAACKKIRDDKGYWKAVEVYVHEHTEAQFSHGLCPDCLDKLYPEADPLGGGVR
jgi:PAS domain S-box-containing protein